MLRYGHLDFLEFNGTLLSKVLFKVLLSVLSDEDVLLVFEWDCMNLSVYNMTENNGKYTDESWAAFEAARKAALDYAAERPVSENDTTSTDLKEYKNKEELA